MDLPGGSQSTVRWRIAFVIALLACVILAAYYLGPSFKTVVEVGALLLTIVNALIEPDASEEKARKVEAVFFNRILQVTAFTKGATVFLWCVTLAIAASAIYEGYRSFETRTIEGMVVSATKQPLSQVLVTLLRNDQVELTTATSGDGKFRFENVDIRGLQVGQLIVEVQYKDLKSRVPVDFHSKASSEMRITMSQGPSPFRVFYFDVDGLAIDFLMRGEIDAAWDKRLGGHPFLIPNKVHREMSSLITNFSEPMGEPYAITEENSTNIAITGGAKVDWTEFRRKNAGKKFFTGSLPNVTFLTQPTAADISSLSTQAEKWHLEIRPDWLEDGTHGSVLFEGTSTSNVVRLNPAFFFWRFATQEDLKRFAGERSLVVQETNHSIPSEFAVLALIPANLPAIGCATEWLMTLSIRPVKLRTLTLENVTSSPIKVGRASVKEHNSQELREFQSDQAVLRSSSAKLMQLLPQEILAPGEKIAFPLAIVLSPKQSIPGSVLPTSPFDGRTLSAAQRRELVTHIDGVAQVQLPGFPAPGAPHPQPVIFSSTLLAHYLTQANPDPGFEKVYVWGTSLMLDEIEVDGFVYPVRQYDPEVFAIWEDSGGVGSCPYVYTRANEEDLWQRQGHILYGFNASHKESTDEIKLLRFDGTVLIKEEDPEVSYIDQLFVRETTTDGQSRILVPDNPALQHRDGQYVSLRKGENLLVRFRSFSGASGSKYTVVAHGYYLPDWRTKEMPPKTRIVAK